MEISLEPDTMHCVETMAKNEYERVLGLLMKNNQEDSQLEARLELLRHFLESADFGTLRSRCDEFLLDSRRVIVKVTSINKPPYYEIEISEVL